MIRPWYETIFDERYPELFGPLERDPEEEVARIVNLLAIPPGAAVVDLGCGRGRHAIPLSRRGYRVTGVDISEKMLRLARERANRELVSVEWVQEDMREFLRPDAFDACLSLFTSFGYFDDEQNEKVLRNVGRNLKVGGSLLLDLRNAQKGLAGEEDHEMTMTVPAGRLRLCVRFDRSTGRAHAEHELTRPDGIRISSRFDVRIYSEGELAAMIARAGMRIRFVHGSLDGAPFSRGAERMVVIAVRE
ncbi:MAG: class SAM-dependent methyltransferase [Deltaproteobacteria bacterium]|nr:class SAM-dependent methyltransferase [Deltaproteobacteria bacterium]